MRVIERVTSAHDVSQTERFILMVMPIGRQYVSSTTVDLYLFESIQVKEDMLKWSCFAPNATGLQDGYGFYDVPTSSFYVWNNSNLLLFSTSINRSEWKGSFAFDANSIEDKRYQELQAYMRHLHSLWPWYDSPRKLLFLLTERVRMIELITKQADKMEDMLFF